MDTFALARKKVKGLEMIEQILDDLFEEFSRQFEMKLKMFVANIVKTIQEDAKESQKLITNVYGDFMIQRNKYNQKFDRKQL